MNSVMPCAFLSSHHNIHELLRTTIFFTICLPAIAAFTFSSASAACST